MPLEKVEGAKPGKVYTVFFDEELHDLREMFGWLKAAEKSFDFWNNPADAISRAVLGWPLKRALGERCRAADSPHRPLERAPVTAAGLA